MEYEPVIGLEVHAELNTRSKMFCSCPVVDSTQAAPNAAVCPVCSGMPGVLPVVNRLAVEYGVRVALALECEVAETSLFARKNYFYPDLPKGYQISQYEYPLAERGKLLIPDAAEGEHLIRIRRVHLEEDTGKLTHVNGNGQPYSLVDLNRAGVPLLEIVSEPDLRNVEDVRAYAYALRSILRYLGVNSGDLEKGVIRFEANVSIRPVGSTKLGTRTEIKNLNSFRIMEKAVTYEIERQKVLLAGGGTVKQETLGWDEEKSKTYSQRSKEDAHDYRYFPEPDLPPLVVERGWIEKIAHELPELPHARAKRFQTALAIPEKEAHLLVSERAVADYFEACCQSAPEVAGRTAAIWITGELFGWMNQSGQSIEQVQVTPKGLAELLVLIQNNTINPNTAKGVFNEMLTSGQSAMEIVQKRGLQQISDSGFVNELIQQVLRDNPKEVTAYLAGKETLANWFFGQVSRLARGKANPQVVRAELERQLAELKTK